jgi:hypothetical protein
VCQVSCRAHPRANRLWLYAGKIRRFVGAAGALPSRDLRPGARWTAAGCRPAIACGIRRNDPVRRGPLFHPSFHRGADVVHAVGVRHAELPEGARASGAYIAALWRSSFTQLRTHQKSGLWPETSLSACVRHARSGSRCGNTLARWQARGPQTEARGYLQRLKIGACGAGEAMTPTGRQ